MRAWIIAVVLLVLGALTPGAFAASFDCTNAVTPFEIAICDNPALSAADDLLAKSFATAVGGLTKPALMEMRADQRQWLDFAQADCTDDAKPLTDAAYSSEQVDCLSTVFAQRSTTLEDSRMLGGLRFYLNTKYAALPDTDPDNAEYWKVASYDVSLPRIDGDDAAAKGFNAFIAQQGETLSNLLAPAGSGEDRALDPSSDSSTRAYVDEVLPNRITVKVVNYWFGHGAAHGNTLLTSLHYLMKENRALEASDLFVAEGWQDKLAALTLTQLKADLGEDLMLDDPSSIDALVIDPTRWSFGDQGLEIQFNQYEVAAYATGTPVVTIPWSVLDPMLNPDYGTLLYGY